MCAPVEATGGTYYGFELSPAAVGIQKWDLNYPLGASHPRAGIALLLDVIEHCDNPGIALRHVAQVIAPNGWLLVTSPNPCWSRSRLHALTKGVPVCFTEEDLNLNHHVFTPWPHILMQYLINEGFVIHEYVTLDGRASWPRGRTERLYIMRLFLAVVMMSIEQWDPKACGLSYGLLARKTAEA